MHRRTRTSFALLAILTIALTVGAALPATAAPSSASDDAGVVSILADLWAEITAWLAPSEGVSKSTSDPADPEDGEDPGADPEFGPGVVPGG